MNLIFFSQDTSPTEIYTLSLHDALPIYRKSRRIMAKKVKTTIKLYCPAGQANPDRKSTRLNSSHGYISYAVFCLKKKNDIRVNRDKKSGMVNITSSVNSRERSVINSILL